MAYIQRSKIPSWLDEVRDKHSIQMIANVPHAAVIHEGRKPNARGPSADMLKDWCRRVLHDESAAFVVARAIHRRGFNPKFHSGNSSAKYFWKPLKSDHRKWLKHLVENAPEEGIFRVLNRIGGLWEGEARFILGSGRGRGRWFDLGTLSSSIQVRVD